MRNRPDDHEACGPKLHDQREDRGDVLGMLPIVHQILGGFFVFTGLIILPLPIPFGLILLTIGLALLAPYIPQIQRLVQKMRAKWPNLDKSLLRYRDHFPPVIRKTIDKTHPVTTAE